MPFEKYKKYMMTWIRITCDVYFPYHRVQLEMHLCCIPFVSSIHFRGHVIELRWMFVHFCQPFLDPMQDHYTLDVFVSNWNVKNLKINWIEIVIGAWWIEIKMLTRRPKEYKQSVTCGMFRRSNRSAVWKISSSGTPYFFKPAWKRWIFSINWKLVPRSWIFFTEPGANLLINLHRTTPSFKISS